MSSVRQVGLGILAALFSTAIIFGSLLLALVEGGVTLAKLPGVINTPQAITLQPGEPTFTPTPTSPPTATPTPPCKDIPSDWIEYPIFPGDSLPAIAQLHGIAVEALKTSNCLDSNQLKPGSVLYVPAMTNTPTATPTNTPTPTTAEEEKPKATKKPASTCSGPPRGWVSYRIRSGDTLFRIATTYALSAAELRTANCLRSNNIRTGQIIYVPFRLTRTPRPTATARSSPQPPPVETTLPPPEETEPPVVPPTEPPVVLPTEPPVVPPSEPPAPEPSEPYPPPPS